MLTEHARDRASSYEEEQPGNKGGDRRGILDGARQKAARFAPSPRSSGSEMETGAGNPERFGVESAESAHACQRSKVGQR